MSLTLDPHLRTAKYLYEDEMLRVHPFVQEIITKVSNRPGFSANQKEDESDYYGYAARMSDLKRLVEETAITEIASIFRSSVETVSASAGGGGAPGSTISPTSSSTDFVPHQR